MTDPMQLVAITRGGVDRRMPLSPAARDMTGRLASTRKCALLCLAFALNSAAAHGQIVNHCRPDGAGGFVCQLERLPPKPPPELTPERIAEIREIIRSEIPTVPYEMTPDEETAMERYGGTATNEERAAQPRSQFAACEDRLDNMGCSHVDKAKTCTGLSIHAPTKEEQAAYDNARRAKFDAAMENQRRAGEALRDKIAAERAGRSKPGQENAPHP